MSEFPRTDSLSVNPLPHIRPRLSKAMSQSSQKNSQHSPEKLNDQNSPVKFKDSRDSSKESRRSGNPLFRQMSSVNGTMLQSLDLHKVQEETSPNQREMLLNNEHFIALLERVKKVEAFFPAGIVNSNVRAGFQAKYLQQTIQSAL